MRTDRPPHLRLVVDRRDDHAADMAVIEQVVRNLVEDAKTVTRAALHAVADEFVWHGLEPELARTPALRDVIFDICLRVFHDRIVMGLRDERVSAANVPGIWDIADFPTTAPDWLLRRVGSRMGVGQ